MNNNQLTSGIVLEETVEPGFTNGEGGLLWKLLFLAFVHGIHDFLLILSRSFRLIDGPDRPHKLPVELEPVAVWEVSVLDLLGDDFAFDQDLGGEQRMVWQPFIPNFLGQEYVLFLLDNLLEEEQ